MVMIGIRKFNSNIHFPKNLKDGSIDKYFSLNTKFDTKVLGF